MPDGSERKSQLALLRQLLTISRDGGRGLAMLAKAIALAEAPMDPVDDAENISGNLISYCVREAIDSIFPKLGDPKIREASERLIVRWRRVTAQPGADLGAPLREAFDELARALEAATAGFLPRASAFLGVLHPGIAADIGIPAMTTLRDLNKDANAGLHGSKTHDEAVALLDLLLARLVDLVAPLAIAVPQYQVLIDGSDFRALAALLARNPDPRIRVYVFDRVRDPMLAQELDIAELLPSPSSWLAHGYVRHLAEDQPAAFGQFVDRIPGSLMTETLASQLLTCATFAGAAGANEVDRLSGLAGGSVRVDFILRWLRSHDDDAPEALWWRILTRLISLVDTSRFARALHGFSEVLERAMGRLPAVNGTARSRFSTSVLAALVRLDAESPYRINIHFDNPHLRSLSTSDLIVDAAVRLVASASAAEEKWDLSQLRDYSREAVERAALSESITLAPPQRSRAIAQDAFESVLARIANDGWPFAEEELSLAAIYPLAGKDAAARFEAALGDPPPRGQLQRDVANAGEMRADWFRLGQWAAHFPEEARPQRWTAVLRESADLGITFGPTPPSAFLAEPRAHESSLDALDVPRVSVPEFVERVNAALAVNETGDPRFAMTLRETVTAHATEHRAAWADDHRSIGQIHDLWVRRMIIGALKSEANDAPRLGWEQLQDLWAELLAETAALETAETEQLKPALSQLAGEILEHLRHRVAERPRAADDINWWSRDAFIPLVPVLAWVGDDEPDVGMPSLFSMRGEVVRLLVALSSPIDEDRERDIALGRALDILAAAAASDPAYARSLGQWARWLIYRAPEWWKRASGSLIGTSSRNDVREAVFGGNFDSGNFALDLLGADLVILNSYSSTDAEDASYAALAAVLFNAVPIESIEEATWSAIFRDSRSTENALRYLFPEESLDDVRAVRRFEILRLIAKTPSQADLIWRSIDVLAVSPDVSDEDLFGFAAGLAETHRGAPMSTFHFADRLVRAIANPQTVAVLEAMCSGNLGGDRAMAQYELTSVNDWFQQKGSTLPEDLRTRVGHALFEIGFPPS